MSSSWALQPLGQLCDVLDSKRRPVTKRDRIAGPYPYYGATGIQDYVAEWIFDEPLVLVGEDGAKWGSGDSSAFSIEGKTWVNNHAHVLRPRRNSVLDKWLIFYLNHADLTHFVSGMTVPKLNQENLRRIPVPVPPLPEQQRIVGILDQAFEGITKAKANAERNLANAKELFESERESLFADDAEADERGFDEICNITSTLVDPREEVYQPMLHVGAGNIESDTGDLTNVQSAAAEKLISGKFTFDESMVLYSKIRPYLKKVVAPDFRGLCSADIYPLTPTAGVMERDYLYHVLLTKRFTEYAMSGSDRAGMPKVNRNHLFAYKVGVPSIARQIEVIDRLEYVSATSERLLSNYKSRIRGIDELKASLLHQTFSGSL